MLNINASTDTQKKNKVLSPLLSELRSCVEVRMARVCIKKISKTIKNTNKSFANKIHKYKVGVHVSKYSTNQLLFEAALAVFSKIFLDVNRYIMIKKSTKVKILESVLNIKLYGKLDECNIIIISKVLNSTNFLPKLKLKLIEAFPSLLIKVCMKKRSKIPEITIGINTKLANIGLYCKFKILFNIISICTYKSTDSIIRYLILKMFINSVEST